MKLRSKEEITKICDELYAIVTKNWQPSLGYEALVKGGIVLGIAHEEETRIEQLESEKADLEKKLEEAVEVIRFYANPMTYFSDHEGGGFGYIAEDDREDIETIIPEFDDKEPDFYDEVGGKRAREFLAKINK